jgi:hypothetical protein
MKITLEELKAMSDSELHCLWASWQFPFDKLLGTCGACLTGHSFEYRVSCGHDAFHEQIVLEMGLNHYVAVGSDIRPWLENIYALRLFYDSLYPQNRERICDERRARQEAETAA